MSGKVAVYIRVSTQDQRLDGQRAEIKRWLTSHGHKPKAVTWFEDKETGKSLNRPAFKKLEAGVFSGEVKTVVVWKLDRIARSIRDGVNVIADWCERGVRVVSVTQQIDLSGSAGRMMASLLFGIAEIELEHARERQAAGIAQAKKRGAYRGRKKGTTIGKPDRAQELKGRGLKVREIAAAMNVSERTASRYLKG